jgi:hypothetical protein
LARRGPQATRICNGDKVPELMKLYWLERHHYHTAIDLFFNIGTAALEICQSNTREDTAFKYPHNIVFTSDSVSDYQRA